MTKIVPIDQDVEKETAPVADQKVIGAMVEMLSGLDQRLNEYFEDQDPEKPVKKKQMQNDQKSE